MALPVSSSCRFTSKEDEALAKSWGLVGGFEGDDKLLRELQWVQNELDIHQHRDMHLPRLCGLIDILPSASRQALATQILAQHAQKDPIIQELFDYAFAPDEHEIEDPAENSLEEHPTDDFVLLWTDSTRFMNPRRYAIFHTVLLLLNFVSVPVALRLCRAYFASASTQHTGTLLAFCTRQSTDVFDDTELQVLFDGSPLLVQKQVLTTCRSMAPNNNSNTPGLHPTHPRQDFLMRVWKTMYELDPSIVFWCSSQVVQQHILKEPTRSTTNQVLSQLGMQRWNTHASVYLSYLQQRLSNEPNPLLRGTLWRVQLLPLLVAHGKNPTNQWSPSQTRAIQALLDDYTVLEIVGHPPRLARERLEQLASQEDSTAAPQKNSPAALLLNYPHIQRVTISPLRPLTKPERLQKTLHAIQHSHWNDFQTHHTGLSYNHLPFRATFQKATLGDLWTAITNKAMPSSPSQEEQDHTRFLRFFYQSDFTSHRERSFTIDALVAWCEWHFRSTPDQLSTEQLEWFGMHAKSHHANHVQYQAQFDDARHTQREKVLEHLWSAWYESLTSRYFGNGLVNTTVQRVLDAQKTCLTMDPKSKITLDCRYMHVLLTMASRGIETMPAKYWTTETQINQWQRLLALMGMLKESRHLPVVASLNETMSHFMMKHYLVLLEENLLFFDLLADPKRYAKTSTNLNTFGTHAQWIAERLRDHPKNEQLWDVFTGIMIRVLQRATRDGRHDSGETLLEVKDSQTNKVRFLYYDPAMHNRVIQRVVDLLKVTLNGGLNEFSYLSCKVFFAFVQYYFIKEKDWETKPAAVLVFLNLCHRGFPSVVYERERKFIMQKASIVLQSSATLLSDKRMVAQYLQSMGMLTSFLEGPYGAMLSEDTKTDLMIAVESFQYEPYREKLRAATTGLDAEGRVEGHVAWLRSAANSKDLSSISFALQFTENRIRNEAGLYRRQVYQCISTILYSQIIRPSLEKATESTLSDVKAISDTILSMLQNDLLKRDSVQRFHFPRIPAETIQEIVHHGSSCKQSEASRTLLKPIRQAWIEFATEMHWLQTKSNGGDESLMSIHWPFSGLLKSTTWIEYNDFINAYPRNLSFLQVGRLQVRVNLKNHVKDDLSMYLGPHELVECLVQAMERLWKTRFSQYPLLSWSEKEFVPEDDAQRKALQQRLFGLFSICGSAWESVNILTVVFDRTFEKIETAPYSHFRFALDLLEKVLECSLGRNTTPHIHLVPRTANALDRVVRCGVKIWANLNDNQMKSFLDIWKKSLVGQQEMDWTQVPMPSSRARHFIAKYSETCEPPKCTHMADKALPKLILAREMIGLSPSAIWTNEIKDILLNEREDVFARLFETDSIMNGPFAGKTKSFARLLYDFLSSSSLNSIPPALTMKYAETALTIANSEDNGISEKVIAIEKFCTSPSTGHMDVMRALETDLLDPLREAIIIKSFSLDAPWHVVSFLLKTSLVDKKKQRMCSKLLTHIQKFCNVDTGK